MAYMVPYRPGSDLLRLDLWPSEEILKEYREVCVPLGTVLPRFYEVVTVREHLVNRIRIVDEIMKNIMDGGVCYEDW